MRPYNQQLSSDIASGKLDDVLGEIEEDIKTGRFHSGFGNISPRGAPAPRAPEVKETAKLRTNPLRTQHPLR